MRLPWIVIPGHGPLGGKAQLIDFRGMLVSIRDKVAALKKQGRSLDDAKWGGFLIDGKTFTGLVYAGV